MHKEYKRICNGADKAVLFIHGIVGTPNHFSDFVQLVPDRISVHNVLLDGHGKGVRDFSKTAMAKWKLQITLSVMELADTHKEVYIVAHSLGSLLAIEQAICNPKVTKLFLLATPLKLFLKPKMFRNSIRMFLGKIPPEDAELAAAKKCYGIEPDKNPFHYLGWIPRYWELFEEIPNIRTKVDQICIPVIAYQSAKDEMVSQKATEILKRNPNISVFSLENSGHYYYEATDYDRLLKAFQFFIS